MKRSTRLLTMLHFLPTSVFLRAAYLNETGHILHLKNPRRFNEKLNWLLTGIGSATQAPDAVPEPEETPQPEATPVPEPPADPQPTDAPQTDYKTMYVVNVESHVNLRKEPSTSADVLKQIPKNAAVQFTGDQQGDFLKVVYEGETGYAHGGYLSYENPNPVMLTVINCKKSVTLRKAPSIDAKKLAAIPLGGTVKYLNGAKDGFLKVEYEGKTGYVMGTYLTDPKR